jgi:hypothetical protein
MPIQAGDKVRFRESLYNEVSVGQASLQDGAAAGDIQTFISPTRITTVNPTTEDGFDFDLITPRTVEIDVATVTFTPVVRWTAIDTPTADQTVQWKLDYTYAFPTLFAGIGAKSGTKFIDARTMTTAICTLTGAEYRQHIVTPFAGQMSFPSRDAAVAFLVKGNVRISSVSTAANSLIGVLGVGLAYLEGPSGTSSIVP